ncbi:hypothetical protein [Flavobacterium sp. SM2513]|uniref:hypothetical protein n=1 Tax=Flavobacterium sp. SM2513 TaxID=3424766 RepID=UPI003D7FEDF3
MKLKDDSKFAIAATSLIVGIVLSAEITSFLIFKQSEYDYFSPTLGLVSWFCIYMASQDCINKKSFKEITLIGILIVIICFFKQSLTQFNYFTLAISAVSLLFAAYFRLILFLFYNNYARQKPVVMFFSRSSVDYEGKDKGYKPTVKDKIFSVLLIFGFIYLCVGVLACMK